MRPHTPIEAAFAPNPNRDLARRGPRRAAFVYRTALGKWDRHQVDCRSCLRRAMRMCPEGEFLADAVRDGRRRWSAASSMPGDRAARRDVRRLAASAPTDRPVRLGLAIATVRTPGRGFDPG